MGVPEKVLYKLYVQANNVFVTLRAKHAEISSSGLEVTSVVLLANPSHQTAINTRKKSIQAGLQTVENELGYIASLLSLKQNSKVSMLWRHRRWLFFHHYGLFSNISSYIEMTDTDEQFRCLILPLNVYKSELDIISKACDNHTYPRNYHAWTHRWLVIQSYAFSLTAAEKPTSTSCIDNSKVELEQLQSNPLQELSDAKFWIERHVSDFSAVHYFCQVLILFHSFKHSIVNEENSSASAILAGEAVISAEAAVEHAFELVQAYDKHESLWLYLRSAISIHYAFQRKCSIEDEANYRNSSTKSLSSETLLESKIRPWAMLLAQPGQLHTNSGLPDENLINSHAQAFLEWLSSYKSIYATNILRSP